jgi:sigma-E factor negative regulatory protein RseC
MQQRVQVTRLLDNGFAEVSLHRQSACAGDCHRCGGCATEGEVIHVRAYNSIGAQPGDTVMVETAGKTVLSAALLVYLVPLLLFFFGWAVGYAVGLPGMTALCCALGFLLGIIPAVIYNRFLTKTKPVTYTITAFA